MEKHYLLQFEDNYADEFDAHGSVILNEYQHKELYSIVEQAITTENYSTLNKEYISDIWVCLGTNEYIEYDNIADLMKQVKCTELTDDEYDILMKFGFNRFGFTDFWNTITDAVASDSDDEDDEEDSE